MSKKTVAVFFGGKSPEHDVSIITALVSVIPSLKLLGHNVIPIYITKQGDWLTGEEFADVKTYQTGDMTQLLSQSKPLSVRFANGFSIVQPGTLGREKVTKIDAAFPATHGSYGEDGSLMGLLRMAGIPFVGSDMESSAVAMNKVLAKVVVEKNDIATSKFLSFRAEELTEHADALVKKIVKELSFPLFVKPPHLGSSIGISKVKDQQELVNALEVAAHYDNEILVEEAVDNLIEITVPIIGPSDQPEASLPERPLNTADEVFDFDSKYLHGGKKGGGKSGSQGYSEVPANIPESLYNECLRVAKKVYSVVGLSGIARVDLLIDEKAKKVYFNEINPMPGSLYAHNFAKNGISGVELVKKLLDQADRDFAARQKVTTTFDTNYLKQF
jgi:D-alanine-D-alanine ligase